MNGKLTVLPIQIPIQESSHVINAP